MIYYFNKNYKKILIPILVLLFFYAIFYGFPDSPSPWLDEGINVGIVKSWVETGVYSFQLGPNSFVAERPWLITNNYPVLAPIALSFLLFGIGLWQVKIVMILFVISFLLTVFTFVKKNYSEKSAYISLALLISFLPMYGNGLSGALGELPGITFLLVALLFLNSNKAWKVFLSGFFIGICVATKPLFLPILFALAVAELYFAFKNKKLYWGRWVLLFGGVILPLIVWFKTLFPEDLSFAYLKATIDYYSNSQITEDNVVFKNFIKFFTESTPLHFLILSLSFWFFRLKDKSKLTRQEIILWIFVIVDIIYFLRSPGWYRYFFPAHLVALVFSGVIFMYFKNFLVRKNLKQTIVLPLIVLLFSVQTVHLLKGRNDILYYNPSPRHFAEYLNNNIEENKVLFMVDQAAISFLVDHKNTYHNFRINSHLRAGRDLFRDNPYPDYIVATRPEESEYFENYLPELEENFSEVYREGKHILYKVKN